MVSIEERLAKELELKIGVVNNVVEMLDEGNTVPFIARYRKEKTGGLSDEVLSRADYKLSFSKMTFPHQLMRLILLEQVYRAYRINNGEPYHK